MATHQYLFGFQDEEDVTVNIHSQDTVLEKKGERQQE